MIALSIAGWSLTALPGSAKPLLLQLFVRNPHYFQLAYGRVANVTDVDAEFDEEPPASMPYRQRWVLGVMDSHGALVGMATIWQDFITPTVWLISMFLIDNQYQGRSVATGIYQHLEQWMRDKGAHWIRLGVIEGSARAERFWQRNGYTTVRRRIEPNHLPQSQRLRVMIKPLTTESLVTYLQLMPRDRPDAP